MNEEKLLIPGVYDIPNEQYHSPHGISRSALWEFKKSPFHYYSKYIARTVEKEKPTESMFIGELVHVLGLEGNFEFNQRYVLEPNINKRSNAGKQEYLDFQAENKDKTIITLKQYRKVQAMVESLNDNEVFKMIGLGKIEQSIYFNHEPSGILCKSRPDNWLGSTVVDLKTTADGSLKSFTSSAYKLGYYLQAGMIKKALESIGENLEQFVFICVENKAPYAVATYVLDNQGLEFGVNQFDKLISRLAICLERNEWPGYEPQILSIPSYAKYED